MAASFSSLFSNSGSNACCYIAPYLLAAESSIDGRGLFTTAAIPKNTLLVRELPLAGIQASPHEALAAAAHQAQSDPYTSDILNALAATSVPELKLFDRTNSPAERQADSQIEAPFVGAWMKAIIHGTRTKLNDGGNAFVNVQFGGVWPVTALVNHSCAANVTFFIGGNGDLHLFTIRNIDQGEELLACYCEPQMPVEERWAVLGFECRCKWCMFELGPVCKPIIALRQGWVQLALSVNNTSSSASQRRLRKVFQVAKNLPATDEEKKWIRSTLIVAWKLDCITDLISNGEVIAATAGHGKFSSCEEDLSSAASSPTCSSLLLGFASV